MKAKISNYQKTDHFLYRQWDRTISDELISEVLNKRIDIENCSKKILLIVGNDLLRKYKCAKTSKKNLVIVLERNALVTLFLVDDLYQYLKSQTKKSSFYII